VCPGTMPAAGPGGPGGLAGPDQAGKALPAPAAARSREPARPHPARQHESEAEDPAAGPTAFPPRLMLTVTHFRLLSNRRYQMPEIIVEVLGPGYTRRPGIAHEGSAIPAPQLPPPKPLTPPACQADLGEPTSRRRFKIIIQNGQWRPSRATGSIVAICQDRPIDLTGTISNYLRSRERGRGHTNCADTRPGRRLVIDATLNLGLRAPATA
jgi:hypothetical protein